MALAPAFSFFSVACQPQVSEEHTLQIFFSTRRKLPSRVASMWAPEYCGRSNLHSFFADDRLINAREKKANHSIGWWPIGSCDGLGFEGEYPYTH
jgi:hypothetical protein